MPDDELKARRRKRGGGGVCGEGEEKCSIRPRSQEERPSTNKKGNFTGKKNRARRMGLEEL